MPTLHNQQKGKFSERQLTSNKLTLENSWDGFYCELLISVTKYKVNWTLSKQPVLTRPGSRKEKKDATIKSFESLPENGQSKAPGDFVRWIVCTCNQAKGKSLNHIIKLMFIFLIRGIDLTNSYLSFISLLIINLIALFPCSFQLYRYFWLI